MVNLFGSNTNLASLGREYLWAAWIIMVLAVVVGALEGVGIGLLIPLLSAFGTAPASTHAQGALALIERVAAGHSETVAC